MKNSSSAAFTRLELAVTVTAFAMLGLVALPILATTRSDSERAGCFNNLRQIGRGVRQWGSEHQERVPWLTPIEEGGTRFVGKGGNAYEEWATFTNELGAD